jgi:sensor domain CHASE-containing protein
MKKKILIIISIIIVGVAAVFGFSNSDIVRDRVETIEEQTLYGCPSSKKNKKRWSK